MRCTKVSTVTVVALGLLTACSTDTGAASGPTPTTSSSPRPLALPSKTTSSSQPPSGLIQVPMAAGTALAPDGWSHVPPNRAQVGSMAVWLQKYIEGGAGLIGTVLRNIDAMNSAADSGDIRGAKAACDDISQQLSTRIPKALPAPDPDMSAALESVVDAGRALTAKCAAINGTPPAIAVEEVDQSVGRLGSALTVLGSLVQRDATVIASANAKR